MKLFVKIFLLILIIILIAPFFIQGRDGKPLITLDELQKPGALGKMTDRVSDLVDDSVQQGSAGKDRIYTWRDDQGRLHYSNIEPANKTGVNMLEVEPDINVIGSDDPDTPKAALLPVTAPEDEESTGNGPKMIRVYEPESR
jgi:hypothetical protein